jgi:protein O-GlcNAc transferase
MSQVTIEQAIQIAIGHHQAGRLREAEMVYRRVLAVQPENPDALHLLGVIADQFGRAQEAEDLFRQAIAAAPNNPAIYTNLGNFQQKRGQLDQAIESYRMALNLGPDNWQTHNNLGVALASRGQLEQAIASYQRALELKPDFVEALSNLGNAWHGRGSLEQAIACHRKAVELKPDYTDALNNLGRDLKNAGRIDEAIDCYHRALGIAPNIVEVRNNLGVALAEKRESDEAIASYQRALAIKPDYAEAHNNLGNALRNVGRVDDAVASYRRALTLKPDYVGAHSNLLYALLFQPNVDAHQLLAEAQEFDRRRAKPLGKFIRPHDNDRDSERRLRIGYVSPDFRTQSESFFTVPLLEHHDHGQFEIFCYSSVSKSDAITARLRACADVWRDVRAESDEALAQIVRRDRIDILVDLTMHMAGNRALLFARKPAPVQVCWLAYPGTTGLSAMDYRITDSFMDPADADVSCYSEQSVRLPNCWVVYDPLVDIPARPAEQNGPITFGSVNNPAKLNELTLVLWAKLLQAVPTSRLLLQVFSSEHSGRVARMMGGYGIAENRLEFVGRMDRVGFLRRHDQIDIALDLLPYNGITTTCDALYMGTPVLTLVGQTAAGRTGKAILNVIGLKQMVAETAGEFIGKGAELAADIPRLAEIRRTLRGRLEDSPLMDASRFADDMENAYRSMWRTWCQTH